MLQFGKTQEPISESMLSALLPSRPDLQCAYCNIKYTLYSNLRRHVKNHHLGFRFPCACCEAESNRREDLMKHYHSFHPDKVQEAEMIKEVCKVTPEGKVMPLGRPSYRRRRQQVCRVKTEKSQAAPRKRSARVMAKELNTQLSNLREDLQAESEAQVVDSSPPLQASLPAEACLVPQEDISEPQRVIIALDPVSQFRLERVIAERVERITERSVIETLDREGQVTRRETIEREYFLNAH
ncbi:uncharacterized protein LOC119735554 isoform X2 [Patiria miniata]|nr:uncharacterized protein LOC119735554 isoform X2 [Patiria miniata]